MIGLGVSVVDRSELLDYVEQCEGWVDGPRISDHFDVDSTKVAKKLRTYRGMFGLEMREHLDKYQVLQWRVEQ